MKKQLISSALAFCAFAMILPGAVFAQENVSLDFDELPVVRGGLDAGTPENELAELMKRREFTVKIDLGEGSASATVWTGDFTYEYVKINADYHT